MVGGHKNLHRILMSTRVSPLLKFRDPIFEGLPKQPPSKANDLGGHGPVFKGSWRLQVVVTTVSFFCFSSERRMHLEGQLTWNESSEVDHRSNIFARSPSSALSHPFSGWEGSPTKIDYTKQLVPTYSILSTSPELASLFVFFAFWGSRFFVFHSPGKKDIIFCGPKSSLLEDLVRELTAGGSRAR